jgi:hypothetical protein
MNTKTAVFIALMMEAASTSETYVTFYQAVQRHLLRRLAAVRT